MNPGLDYIGISTAFICHDGEGRFLLGKRSKNCRDEHGTWEFGGGKLEFGATLEENVLRELKEEYGCNGVIDQSLPAVTLFRTVGDIKTHWITFPFFVRVSREEARLNEPESMADVHRYYGPIISVVSSVMGIGFWVFFANLFLTVKRRT